MALRFPTLNVQRNRCESGALYHAEQLNRQNNRIHLPTKEKGKTLGQLSSFDEKRLTNLALEPPILGCFHDLDENRRCSTYPGWFLQPDESKRAEKMLELAISSLFRLG
jgi:hypothetical protein